MAGANRRRRRIAREDVPPARAIRRVPVLLPLPLPAPFDYRVPGGMEVAPGDLVLVPLGGREAVGVVWDGEPDRAVGENRLRPISGLIEGPPMRADLRRLVDWIAGYTLAPLGEVLAMALRTNALRPEPPAMAWEVADATAAHSPPDPSAVPPCAIARASAAP